MSQSHVEYQTHPGPQSSGDVLTLTPSPLEPGLLRKLFLNYLAAEFAFTPISDLATLKCYYHDYCKGVSPLGASHTLIDLCFALSCLVTLPPRCPPADSFYKTAQSRLTLLEDQGSTLCQVQCHILQVQYLTTIGELNLALQINRVTIRKARVLGLHTDSFIRSTGDEDHSKELKKRVWHTIQTIERALTMRLGMEPQKFTFDWDIRSPLICDTDWARDIPSLPPPVTYHSLVTFFNANAYLLHIFKGPSDPTARFWPSGLECPLERLTKSDLSEIADFSNKTEREL